ncbi:XRE family transcriptional regulator [Peribacillus saganii]|uniref:XRE family transcriptional regulator n=1 Tax=Peribacillus saganii TaxID=2303992 RepID=A0A372LUH4_9BACI|nr:helix-turn-helix transcriptional regulator [Peribacillus saganii]RFU71450.1 XRE family transcriptional regulator [Peribacillus saganii]
MLQHLGQQIRQLRTQKGKGLNEFAKELHVSAGYLSNLETGKSETIKLDVLEKIQEELKILPVETDSSFSQRFRRIEQNVAELEKKDPIYAEFLIQNIENSIEWFKARSK